MTCWVVALLEGRRRRQELRDKVGHIVSSQYWPVEGEVSRLLHVVETLRSATLFRDITAFDVLAYKYRFRHQPSFDDPVAPNLGLPGSEPRLPSAFDTLKRVERLLDSLALQVPVRGRCPDRVATPFGRTFCGLASATAAVWSDDQAPTISRLVRFFGGAAAAGEFDAARASDVTLEQRVESRVPYVDALRLFGDHFVLADVELSSDVGAFDVRAKVRFIDERLTEPDARVLAARHWRQTLDVYRSACDLCVGAGLVQTRSTLPDFTVETASDDSRVGECVVVLRHLVRLMCGVEQNTNRLGSDDQFLRFLAELHDVVYGWNNGTASSSMMACIERSRANIMAYARALTTDQIFIEPDLTRAVLEGVETELHRHLDYLTVRRVRMTRTTQTVDQERGEGPSVSGTSAAASESRQLEEGMLHPGDSETSIYTMAASYMSPPRGRPSTAVFASPKRYDPAVGGTSAERMSLLSGASSMYTTAASLSSATNDGESSVSARLSPGMPRHSLPHVAGFSRSSTAVPGTVRCDSDGDSEYFETPV